MNYHPSITSSGVLEKHQRFPIVDNNLESETRNRNKHDASLSRLAAWRIDCDDTQNVSACATTSKSTDTRIVNDLLASPSHFGPAWRGPRIQSVSAVHARRHRPAAILIAACPASALACRLAGQDSAQAASHSGDRRFMGAPPVCPAWRICG